MGTGIWEEEAAEDFWVVRAWEGRSRRLLTCFAMVRNYKTEDMARGASPQGLP